MHASPLGQLHCVACPHRISAADGTCRPAEEALQAGGVELDAAVRRLNDCSVACAPTDQGSGLVSGDSPLTSRAAELGSGTDRFPATSESQDGLGIFESIRARSDMRGLCCRRTVAPGGEVLGTGGVAEACARGLAAQLPQLRVIRHEGPVRLPCEVRARPPCRRSRPRSAQDNEPSRLQCRTWTWP